MQCASAPKCIKDLAEKICNPDIIQIEPFSSIIPSQIVLGSVFKKENWEIYILRDTFYNSFLLINENAMTDNFSNNQSI